MYCAYWWSNRSYWRSKQQDRYEKMLTKEEVARNAKEIKGLLERFIVLEGENPAIIVDNADWLKPITYIDFLRGVGVNFNVSEMLKKTYTKID